MLCFYASIMLLCYLGFSIIKGGASNVAEYLATASSASAATPLGLLVGADSRNGSHSRSAPQQKTGPFNDLHKEPEHHHHHHD
jgi:hypothetical protein